jgi:hypothetical protein
MIPAGFMRELDTAATLGYSLTSTGSIKVASLFLGALTRGLTGQSRSTASPAGRSNAAGSPAAFPSHIAHLLFREPATRRIFQIC